MTRDQLQSVIDALAGDAKESDAWDSDEISGILSALWLTMQAGTTAQLREVARRHAVMDFMAAAQARQAQGYDE